MYVDPTFADVPVRAKDAAGISESCRHFAL